jgi:hypothetical protein
MIKEHACREFSIINEFAMEKWEESAEDFSPQKLLLQLETTFPLEKKPHVKLPGNKCHEGKVSTFPLEKKHLVHSPEIPVSPRSFDICRRTGHRSFLVHGVVYIHSGELLSQLPFS